MKQNLIENIDFSSSAQDPRSRSQLESLIFKRNLIENIDFSSSAQDPRSSSQLESSIFKKSLIEKLIERTNVKAFFHDKRTNHKKEKRRCNEIGLSPLAAERCCKVLFWMLLLVVLGG